MGREITFVILIAFASMTQSVLSFSATPQASNPFGAVLDSIFGSSADPAAKEREDLKTTLLEECRQEKPSRDRIEELIASLAELSPTPNAASRYVLVAKDSDMTINVPTNAPRLSPPVFGCRKSGFLNGPQRRKSTFLMIGVLAEQFLRQLTDPCYRI